MTHSRPANTRKTLVVSALVLAAAAGITALIFSTEPTAKRGGATKQTAMLVETTSVERGTFRPVIVATGTVEAEKDIVLRSRVAGEVILVAPSFTPGGFVEKGKQLVRIDPADYRNTLEQRRSELRQAMANLDIEEGRQTVAQQEAEMLDGDLNEKERQLVLRKPQSEVARARVKSAKAAVRQAQLDLQRTTIKAPFDAQVLSREVNVGSQVNNGDPLARLVGHETYWVVASVPRAKLRWLSFPGSNGEEPGSQVKVRNRSAWPEGVFRTGHLDKLVGALDARTRLARVVISVDDPLVREGRDGTPPLMVGAFVEVRVEGKPIEDVVRMPRELVRKNDTAWVMKDGKLSIRKLDIVMRDESHAYVAKGLSEKDRVVTTNLATVSEGAKLRVEASEKQR